MRIWLTNLPPIYGYLLVSYLTFVFTRLYYTSDFQKGDVIEKIVQNVKVEDLIAMSIYNLNNSEELLDQILQEFRAGERDQFYMPKSYLANLNNDHFDDTGLKDEYQKEVYLLAKNVLRELKLRERKQLTVIDVGCGSGYKLVQFLSNEFRTIGIEREPAYSFLKSTYPNQIWYNSENETANLPEEVTSSFGHCDLGMSADVIEHFRNPDYLLNVLKSYKCRFYIMSTPMRELMSWSGPPWNTHHVREWTFFELHVYLKSQGFDIIRSFDGVMQIDTQLHVVKLATL